MCIPLLAVTFERKGRNKPVPSKGQAGAMQVGPAMAMQSWDGATWMANADGEHAAGASVCGLLTQSDRNPSLSAVKRQTKAEAPFVPFEGHPTSHTHSSTHIAVNNFPPQQKKRKQYTFCCCSPLYTPAVGKETTFNVTKASKCSPEN